MYIGHSPEWLLSSYEISNVMTHSGRTAVASNALPNITNQPETDIQRECCEWLLLADSSAQSAILRL